MGMPMGLAKATNYYNKLEAWKDWLHLAKQAHAAGQTLLVRKYQPADNAGWKTIDKRLAALRADLQAAGVATTKRGE